MKLGKKTANATGKVIRKRAKTLKKVAKNNAAAVSSQVKAKPKSQVKAKPKSKAKAKAKPKRKPRAKKP